MHVGHLVGERQRGVRHSTSGVQSGSGHSRSSSDSPEPADQVRETDIADMYAQSRFVCFIRDIADIWRISRSIAHSYCHFRFSGSTYLGQVGTLVGWTASKSEDNADTRTCRPRKLGLPILGYNECVKSGINPMNFNDDYGCVGIVGTNSLVCKVGDLHFNIIINYLVIDYVIINIRVVE